MKKIYLSPPNMVEIEKEMLFKAFDSNWIAPAGPDIEAFENEVSEYLQINSACALNSGSSALHLAMRILGISSSDVVLCPTLTFSASANVILYQNASPVFVDIDLDNWTIDVNLLEKAIHEYNPKALITVDLYGNSCNYDQIINLCEKHNMFLVEDAAEALGSEYKSNKLGTFGQMGVLSFNGNKIITTGGGGMLVSDNEDYIQKAKYLSTQAREPTLHYEHIELGYNYRLSNLLAAIGRGQLTSLDNFVSIKRKIFSRYFDALSLIEGITFISENNDCKSNQWLTTLTIDGKKTGFNRDKIIQILNNENIESRPVWKPMHLQPLYKNFNYVRNKNKDVSAELFNSGICLPSGSNLTKTDQDRIIDIILSQVNN
tara:strand:+ start:2775 stop:3896 length:1122 start_codon:yes stop_codon:yes gene_type:complete